MDKQHTKSSLQLVWIVILMLGLTVATPLGATWAATPSPGLIGSNIIADIAESNSSKVVWITATFEMRVPILPFGNWRQKQQYQGFGSGFFFDENGNILTNAHVVAGAQAVEVLLQGQKNPLPAKVVGVDREFDLAVLKVDLPGKVDYLQLGDSDKTRVGEWVVAIGNPLGLDHSVTQGIISAKGRPLSAGEDSNETTTYENMLQTDAAINPGNSGGPLFNLQGEVIGINTAVSANGQNLGFAIPINLVKENLNELMTRGRIVHPWTGLAMIDVKELSSRARKDLKISVTEGIVVAPYKDSPASRAGIRTYDVITQVDDQVVSDVNEMVKLIRKHKVGDRIRLQLLRNGTTFSVEVVLEEKPQPKN